MKRVAGMLSRLSALAIMILVLAVGQASRLRAETLVAGGMMTSPSVIELALPTGGLFEASPDDEIETWQFVMVSGELPDLSVVEMPVSVMSKSATTGERKGLLVGGGLVFGDHAVTAEITHESRLDPLVMGQIGYRYGAFRGAFGVDMYDESDEDRSLYALRADFSLSSAIVLGGDFVYVDREREESDATGLLRLRMRF